MRAHVFCSAPESGHCGTESACPFRANFGIGSVVTARKEVERGRRRAANRALTSARWNEPPEGRSYQAFTQDLNQTLICAVPQ